MNIGFITCGILCLLFLLLAFIFSVFRGKSAILISGFNTMPKEEREFYDKEQMSKDQRNACLLWAAIQGTGAILSFCVSQYGAIAAFVIWLVVFFKDVHLDAEKAFSKYKK